MSLVEKIESVCRGNKSFILASSVFLGASAFDYFCTQKGLSSGAVRELNPVLNYYIEELGIIPGLLLPKFILNSCSLVAAGLLDKKYKEGKTKIRAEYLLYPLAFTYFLGGIITF